jgi:hypothetical protein
MIRDGCREKSDEVVESAPNPILFFLFWAFATNSTCSSMVRRSMRQCLRACTCDFVRARGRGFGASVRPGRLKAALQRKHFSSWVAAGGGRAGKVQFRNIRVPTL